MLNPQLAEPWIYPAVMGWKECSTAKYLCSTLKTSNVAPVYTRHLNLVTTVPVAVLATNGARPSADKVLNTTTLPVFSVQPPLMLVTTNHFFTRWRHSKWPSSSHEILGSYCEYWLTVVMPYGDRDLVQYWFRYYLMTPSHYLKQCWFIIDGVLWHSFVTNFTGST